MSKPPCSLFVIGKHWKQPVCPSLGDRINCGLSHNGIPHGSVNKGARSMWVQQPGEALLTMVNQENSAKGKV